MAQKVLVGGIVLCYPEHEILNRISSVLVWEASVARSEVDFILNSGAGIRCP